MIRIACEADIPQMLAIYEPYVSQTTFSFEYDVPGEAAFLERFRATTKQFPWLVLEEDGQVLGYAYGSAPFHRAAYRWCCESSVYLHPAAQGRGLGGRLYSALEALLKYQGFRVNYAIITSENTVSMAFHRKMGYTTAAEYHNCGFKFGRWLGVTWMEKRLNLEGLPSSFPTDWQAIQQDAQKFSDILDILSLS